MPTLSSLLASGLIVLLNSLTPIGLDVRRDVPYAPGPSHTADIYAAAGSGPRPVLVYFYGGGWRSGSKAQIRFVGASLARRGFVAVIPDYRHFPSTDLSGLLEDQAAAVGWVLTHAAEIGGDPRRVIVAGHSSGAWGAAMLALDPRWLAGVGARPGQLGGMIGLAGPYMISALTEAIDREVFAGTGPGMQPIDHADAPHPPMLLLAGAADTDVLPVSTTTLADRLREAGGAVEDRLYPGLGHDDLPRTFMGPLARYPEVADRIVEFAKTLPPARGETDPGPPERGSVARP